MSPADTALAAFAAVLVLCVFTSLLFVEWATRGDEGETS